MNRKKRADFWLDGAFHILEFCPFLDTIMESIHLEDVAAFGLPVSSVTQVPSNVVFSVS